MISRDFLLVLLADNSVVMVSLETGKHLLWFDLDLSALDEDDEIVDLVPTQMTNEPYFMILTKKGKLIFYHYTVVDSSTNLKKYLRHLKRYDRPVDQLCRDRMRAAFNEACNRVDYKEYIEQATLKFEGIFTAIINIEIVDLAHLIKIEKKSPVGVFEEQETEFKHVEIVRQKG